MVDKLMNNLSVHMRICAANVSDSDVDSRQAAVSTLATSWKKEKGLLNIVSTVVDIAQSLGGDGFPSLALGEKVQKAIQKKSSSYLYEERPLDVSVCAGMAALSVINNAPSTNVWTIQDVYATALWSALSFQPVLEAERRENLRQEILKAAFRRSITSANLARERRNVPDPLGLEITINESNEVDSNFNAAIASTIESLRHNATLDREELDFLWWAQLARSRLLKRQLSSISEPTRIVASGIEGAEILRRLPCDVHREIVLRTLDDNPELSLEELLLEIAEDREQLCSVLTDSYIIDYPTIFPLLNSICTNNISMPGAYVKRPVSEWGERALLEASFVRMMRHGVSKI